MFNGGTMKQLLIFTIMLLLTILPMQMMANSLQGFFSPASIQLNELKAATFDPANAINQPFLTSFTITNNSNSALTVKMKIEVSWNNKNLFMLEFQSKQALEPQGRLQLTNADLFTNNSSQYFNKVGSADVQIGDIIEKDPVLKKALLSGYFPDGSLQAKISLANAATGYIYESVSTFTITIRNTGSISLFSPGIKVGSLPPKVSQKPVTFLWNAVNTGFNKAWITIREFPPQFVPTSNTMSVTGSLFYETPDDLEAQKLIDRFNFSDFLAFNDGYYYAWQITMDRFTEQNLPEPSKRINDAYSLKSDWYVFQYVSDGTTEQNSNELKALLIRLNDNNVNSLINAGFAPLGTVKLNGRTYSGSDALRIVEELLGKELEIKVGN